MDDLVILGIGRSFIEMSAQREELLQKLKQLQAQQQPQAKPEPEVEGD